LKKNYDQVTIGLNSKNWLVNLRDEADQSVFNEIFKLRNIVLLKKLSLKLPTRLWMSGRTRDFFFVLPSFK